MLGIEHLKTSVFVYRPAGREPQFSEPDTPRALKAAAKQAVARDSATFEHGDVVHEVAPFYLGVLQSQKQHGPQMIYYHRAEGLPADADGDARCMYSYFDNHADSVYAMREVYELCDYRHPQDKVTEFFQANPDMCIRWADWVDGDATRLYPQQRDILRPLHSLDKLFFREHGFSAALNGMGNIKPKAVRLRQGYHNMVMQKMRRLANAADTSRAFQISQSPEQLRVLQRREDAALLNRTAEVEAKKLSSLLHQARDRDLTAAKATYAATQDIGEYYRVLMRDVGFNFTSVHTMVMEAVLDSDNLVEFLEKTQLIQPAIAGSKRRAMFTTPDVLKGHCSETYNFAKKHIIHMVRTQLPRRLEPGAVNPIRTSTELTTWLRRVLAPVREAAIDAGFHEIGELLREEDGMRLSVCDVDEARANKKIRRDCALFRDGIRSEDVVNFCRQPAQLLLEAPAVELLEL